LRPEIEHGLVEPRRATFRQQPVGEFSRFTQAKWLVHEGSCQYSPHVGVEDGNVLTEGKGSNGVCGVLAHSRQSTEFIDSTRYFAIELVANPTSGLVQGLRTPRIPQTAPGHEDFCQRCVRARVGRWELL
jgi:hypothetical protein